MIGLWSKMLYFASTLLMLSYSSVGEEIFGCGGFVKSDVGINYSRVEIKLYTKQGSLKYQTDCAPNNGYYLIPLYDKGDYILKIEPPAGWSFQPDSVALHVDGSSDPCSLNQDINFVFKGFTISGKVLSRGGNKGPNGIKLTLKKHSGEGVLQETETTDGGSYSFIEVLPGHYLIEASHPLWVLDEYRESVKIGQDNVKSGNKIIVSGFDVRGYVFSEGEPIKGVHFLLFSQNKQLSVKGVLGCNSEAVKSFSQQREIPYICHVTSTNDGSFVFPSLPPGNYKLIPFYKGEHIEFDVFPPEVDFTVNEGSFIFPENFQVQGFSVSGKVSSSAKGKGLEGADIFVNGNKYTVTEENGLYHLENMRAGLYQLEVKMPNIFFEPVTMKVTPNTPHLPEIIASRFSLCGHLHIDQYPSGIQEVERTISLKSAEIFFQANIPVQSDGRFCTEVIPGTYIVEAVVSEIEANSGLRFVPFQKTVNLLDQPVLDIQFLQFRADIQGRIKCIKHCSDLLLDLIPLSYNGPSTKTTTTQGGKFHIGRSLPGKYQLSVHKDDWCFKSRTIEFTVSDQNIMDLELVQTGFQATVTLSHPTSCNIKYPSNEIHSIDLQSGKNILCLPESGIYDFIPVGCHLYKKDVFKFDTNNPSYVALNPTKHLVTGSVFTELNVTDIKVTVRKQTSNSQESEVVHLKEPSGKSAELFKYMFSVLVEPHTVLEIKASSSQLLFRPLTAQIKVYDECIEDAIHVLGKKGLFVNGSVTPPLEGVKMQIQEKNTGSVLTEVLTDKNGMFLVGPLDDESDYIVDAAKEGYIFTQQEHLGHFVAYKLAEIIVEVKTESGEPLSGVLLSLSGGVDYRKNSVTQKDGQLSFSGLSPGQYFLRPMLKEFQFEPPAKMIDIKEGTTEKIKVSGKRVAYSLYGVVNSLTGEAEIGVAVEAVGISNGICSQYQEDAISEQGGFFRIRGLQPECEYSIRLKQLADLNQHIERATPEERIIKVTTGDITGVRLIVFRRFSQMDVSGNIVTNQEYLQSLKVRLYKEESPDQIIHTIALGHSSFFHLPALPIDNRTYILRLDCSLPSSSFFMDLPSVAFCANSSFYHFTFSFHPLPKSVDQEMTQGSILALPLAIVVILLMYNYTQLLPLMWQFFYFISSFIHPVRVPLSTESSSVDAVNARRKAKPRRIQ